MKRRDILAAAGVGLAATALAGCKDESTETAGAKQATEQQTFNWKMVTSWPKNFPGVGVGAERFARSLVLPRTRAGDGDDAHQRGHVAVRDKLIRRHRRGNGAGRRGQSEGDEQDKRDKAREHLSPPWEMSCRISDHANGATLSSRRTRQRGVVRPARGRAAERASRSASPAPCRPRRGVRLWQWRRKASARHR